MVLTENRIQRLRKAQDLTLTQLAAMCGVCENTVRRWESGQTGVPDKHKLNLAALFGVTISYLMAWDEPNGDNGIQKVA